MQLARTLPATWKVPWRLMGWALYIGVNAALLVILVTGLHPGTDHPDWQLWLSLPDKLATGTLYAQTGETRWVWSPVIAPLMAAVPFIGYGAWMAVHVAAVGLLRNWRLIGLVLISWGFWIDAIGGNTFGFVLVAAVLALRGSRAAGMVFLALTILMPRPIQIPLALWLLWSRPDLRIPTLVAFVLHGVAVALTGYGDDWIAALIRQAGPTIGNIGPTFIFGTAWLMVGVPLGIYLAWRRRFGWAGVAISPYMLPAYWLWPLVDLECRRALSRHQTPRSSMRRS